jgi:HSP20 family protein
MSEGKEITEETQARGRVQSPRPIRPPVDVFEDADRITLYADLPGVAPDQLDVSVEDNVLTISASASLSTPKEMKVAYAEFRTPSYLREFTLSNELDADKIDAALRNGVLTLTIPKHERAKPRKITVDVG